MFDTLSDGASKGKSSKNLGIFIPPCFLPPLRFSEAPFNRDCPSFPSLCTVCRRLLICSYSHQNFKTSNILEHQGRAVIFTLILSHHWSIEVLTGSLKSVTAQNYSNKWGRVCGIWEWRHNSSAGVCVWPKLILAHLCTLCKILRYVVKLFVPPQHFETSLGKEICFQRHL